MPVSDFQFADAPGLARLVRWFEADALPNWASRGFDRNCGQFIEALDLNGAPMKDSTVRVRSAARQIHTFADAVRLKIAAADHLAIAETAFEALHAAAWHASGAGGYGRIIDRHTRTMVDPTRDLYDNACVLLAIASLLRATGKSSYRRHAERLLDATDELLGSGSGGWMEDEHGTLPRRQNPHMHMFEAALALFEGTGAAEHRERLDSIHRLFQARFFDAASGILCEFFGPNWEVAARFGSNRLEPGHMCEWVTLLSRYAHMTGATTADVEAQLLETALSIGRHGETLLLDEVDMRGTPLKSSRRLWPQAELMKAHLARLVASGDTRQLQAADAIATEVQDLYLSDTPRGTWRDQFGPDGRSLATSIPASSIYHLGTVVAAFVELKSPPKTGPVA